MSRADLNMRVVGVREALQALRDVPRNVQIKHVRIGLNKAGGMLRNAASNFARVDTGLLKKSLKVKVVVPNASHNAAHHGKLAYVVVGPGRNTGRMMRRTSRGTMRGHAKAQKAFLETIKLSRGAGGRGREPIRAAKAFVGQNYSDATYRNPSRYAHLVEKGTRRVRPRPFLGMAVRIVGQAAMAAGVQKINDGLKMEANLAYARSIGKFR